MASILYVGHATTLIELDGVQLVDGSASAPLRRASPSGSCPLGETLPAPDAVLLSHLHADHLAPAVAPPSRPVRLLARAPGRRLALRRQGFRRVVELAPGDSTNVGELTIAAVTGSPRRQALPGRAGGRCARLRRHRLAVPVLRGRHRLLRGDDRARRCRRRPAARLGLGRQGRPGHLDPTRAAEALRLLGHAWRSRSTGGRTRRCTGGCLAHQPPSRTPPERSPPRPPASRPTSRCASSSRASTPPSELHSPLRSASHACACRSRDRVDPGEDRAGYAVRDACDRTGHARDRVALQRPTVGAKRREPAGDAPASTRRASGPVVRHDPGDEAQWD